MAASSRGSRAFHSSPPYSATVSSRVTRAAKAYGEYQLDGTVAGSQTRAVMGLAPSWTLLEGLKLQLGYERTQVFGGSGRAPATGSVASAALDQLTRSMATSLAGISAVAPTDHGSISPVPSV